jgi:DNA-binding MarR family transcriptional regulator
MRNGRTLRAHRVDKLGWVTRSRCEDDHRVVWCNVTPAGLEILARTDAIVDEGPVEQMAPLSSEEQRQLVALLERVRASLSRSAR